MFGDIIPGCCTPSLQGEHLNGHLDQLHLLPETFHFILSSFPAQGCGNWSARGQVAEGTKGLQDVY